MLKRLILLGSVMLLLISCSTDNSVAEAAHPTLSLSATEAQQIMTSLGDLPLMSASYEALKYSVDEILDVPLEVPQPGEAGGYAHERHKQNYREMKNAGYLFTFTGETVYADFVKKMLDEYAELYPTLGPHPLSKKQKPGRLFHQLLNENVWLLNTAQAYDCIYEWLGPEDREKYESHIFMPLVNLISVEYGEELDRIHNHGMWSSAAVGMIGLAMGDDAVVNRAIYGTKLDTTGGFLAQIEGLFSPDGYYMEGAYYVRYAMRPLLFFSEALERSKPELKIFEFKDQILKKAFYSAVQMTYPNGAFIPINDASLEMNILAPGVVFGTSVIFDRYGFDENLLGLAKIQGSVYPNGSGLKLAKAYAAQDEVNEPTWSSIEFRDGADGHQGGFGILRAGKGKDQSLLAMKYGVHGLGHGHFDKLNFIFYDQGSDVVPDYGFSRYVNIEIKYGGRYLPENNSYAKQTVAHNTLVVDRRTQNNGNRKVADKLHAVRHFFETKDPDVQVMSAKANGYYDGVDMQRTLFLIDDDRLKHPVVIDVYRVDAERRHVYDMPLHFKGQIMQASFDYEANTEVQRALGKDHGYQHIWETAQADVTNDASLTWLEGNRYYSYLTDVEGEAQIILGMTGAGDPNFNLRNEPLLINRASGEDMVFASVLEPHGYYNLAQEKSVNAHPTFKEIKVVGHSEEATVVEIFGSNDLHWVLMINNMTADADKQNEVEFSGQAYTWKGNYKVSLK